MDELQFWVDTNYEMYEYILTDIESPDEVMDELSFLPLEDTGDNHSFQILCYTAAVIYAEWYDDFIIPNYIKIFKEILDFYRGQDNLISGIDEVYKALRRSEAWDKDSAFDDITSCIPITQATVMAHYYHYFKHYDKEFFNTYISIAQEAMQERINEALNYTLSTEKPPLSFSEIQEKDYRVSDYDLIAVALRTNSGVLVSPDIIRAFAAVRKYEAERQLAVELQELIVSKMLNPQKNTYDSDINLPEWSGDIEVRITGSETSKKVNDSPANAERRANRLNSVGNKLKKELRDDAEAEIRRKYYHISLTALANEYTNGEANLKDSVIRIIRNIAFSNTLQIEYLPIMLIPELKSEIDKWKNHKGRLLYDSRKDDAKVWKMIENQGDVTLLFSSYCIAKKLILIECERVSEYNKNVRKISTNNELKGIYQAARILKGSTVPPLNTETEIWEMRDHILKDGKIDINDIAEKNCLDSRTIEKRIHALFGNAKFRPFSVPAAVLPDVENVLNQTQQKQWLTYKRYENSNEIWSHIKSTDDVMLMYDIYELSLKLTAVSYKMKSQYETIVKYFSEDTNIQAVIYAGKIMK